jgi:hypothetical protein
MITLMSGIVFPAFRHKYVEGASGFKIARALGLAGFTRGCSSAVNVIILRPFTARHFKARLRVNVSCPVTSCEPHKPVQWFPESADTAGKSRSQSDDAR